MLLVPLLTACGPADEGSIGMMVNADGHVIVMVETCSAVIESVMLQREHELSPDLVWSDDSVSMGHDAVQTFDTGLLAADLPAGSYVASAETDDIDAQVDFTRARRRDLVGLGLGKVLWLNEPGYGQEPIVASEDDFAQHKHC